MADASCILRRFRLTPDHCLVTLLAVEGLLWLSNRLGWPPWHKGYAVLTAVAAVAVMLLLMLLWFGVAVLFHRRFQFGIRSLLVLTVAVALPFGWLSWEMTTARGQKDAVERIRKAKLQIRYDYQYGAQGNLKSAATSGPTWAHDWFGDDFLSDVAAVEVPFGAAGDTFGGFSPVHDCVATDQDVLPVKRFRRICVLNLAGTRITDAGVRCVEGLPELQSLSLWCTNVGDKSMAYLRGLGNLRDLDISQTKVTNSGLVHLKDLPQLESISLGGTAVDDNGLRLLAECRRLKKVNLWAREFSHQFTPAGVARFRRSMPNCDVFY
jgi:hypothetical protein